MIRHAVNAPVMGTFQGNMSAFASLHDELGLFTFGLESVVRWNVGFKFEIYIYILKDKHICE